MNEYLQKLHELCQSLELKGSDDYEERPLSIKYDGYIRLNYPWAYLTFDVQGSLCFTDIKLIETMIEGFIKAEGGRIDSMSLDVHKKTSLNISIIIPKVAM